jgi:hypothetical protein
MDSGIIIIVLELRRSFLEGYSQSREVRKCMYLVRTCKRGTFTFSVNFTILKGCDRRDRPDRRFSGIDPYHVHGRTLFIFTFLMRYLEFKTFLIGVIVICISSSTFCADDRLSIALNFCAVHMWSSAFDRHRNGR